MSSVSDLMSFGLLLAWLASICALLILGAFVGWARSAAGRERCWRFGQRALLASLAASALVGVGLSMEHFGWAAESLPESGRALGLYPDGLGVWMAMMVSFIGWVILRFADSYLRNDPGRDRFLPWLMVIIASVCVLVFTNHLVIMACAWVAVSLALHHLLTLYGERPQARLAAVQKFIVSRIADVLIFTGVGLLYLHHGTFVLPDIIAAAASGAGSGSYPTLASVAFALAAVLKCAQIPFHGWLLRVMEAPTPVSALLHAGVINLGGFLWLRLFPVFEGFTAGHTILVMVGGFTAVIAVLTMMTQFSVKHALAWSTCAQMGFMLFEIGMGAYTLALLHLLAHSCYKAHSFLASGRTVAVSSKPGFPLASARRRFVRSGLCAAAALGIIALAPQLVEHNPILAAILVLAVGYAAYGIPSGLTRANGLRLCVLTVALVPAYWVLHLLVAPALPDHALIAIPLSVYALGAGLLAALILGAIATKCGATQGWARRLATHFRHGLYLEQPFDRMTRNLAIGSLQVPALLKPERYPGPQMEERL